MWVAPIAGAVSWKAPPLRSARRRMLDRPLERAGVPRPRPLSVMSRVISPSWSTREMAQAVAGGAGVACAVGQGFAGDGEDVVGQRLVRARVEWAGEADAGGEAELRGVLVDELYDPGGQPGGGRAGLVETEDAGADLVDDLVQGVNVAVDSLRGRGVGAGGIALQSHAEGEQVLDDVVVQVARDPVVVFGLGQGDLVGAGLDEFHRHGGAGGDSG